MNTQKKEKREYNTPYIERIKLDNEISLILESDNDPAGDPTHQANVQEHFNNDPFKTNLG